MGAKLAKRVLEKYPEHDIDVIIPVPGKKHKQLRRVQQYCSGFPCS